MAACTGERGPYTFLCLRRTRFRGDGVLTHLGLAPVWLQCLAIASAPAAGVGVSIAFMREWRAMVQSAPKP